MLRATILIATPLIAFPLASIRQPAFGAEIHWPGWRGPNRDGWVDTFQRPQTWPERLKRVWHVEVGVGYASPLVSGGRVYQHARQGESEVVWCLDVATGDVKWRKSYDAPFTMGGGGERHGKGPKSSPAMADGRLFTLSITGVLSAWDADSGELIWRRDFGPRFKAPHPRWGVATSPLVVGSRVVVHFGTDFDGALIALDVRDGTEVWKAVDDGPSYASPILVEIQGQSQIVEWNERALVGVDSDSGRVLWEHPFPQSFTDQNMPTPVFHKGRILLGAENRGIHSLEPRGNDGEWSVRELWGQDKVALDMSTAVVNNDLVFGFSHYGLGRMFCLDPKSGEVLWQGPGRTGDNVALLSIPGFIVALIDDGELQIIEASAEGFKKAASYRVADSPTWAPPVLLENAVLVKDLDTLTLWSFGDANVRSID